MGRIVRITLFCFLVGLLFILQRSVDDLYLYPFPTLSQLPAIDEKPYLELGGMFLGLRAAAADLVWINTLQYYGGGAADEGEHEHAHREDCQQEGCHEHEHHSHHDLDSEAYQRLYPLCKRAIWLDPYFMHVYYLGSAAIGFVQERYEEASRLLEEGVVWNYDPHNVHYWRMNYALAALGYAKLQDYKRLVRVLEQIVDYNESPLILLRVLANTYEKNGEYAKSLALWLYIAERFPDVKDHAEQKVKKLSLRQVR